MVKKCIIGMCGLPGSGKTTTANKLNGKLGISVLNPSIFRTEKPHSLIESQIVDDLWYASVERCIRNENSVIMDATFHTQKKREKLYRFSDRLDCNLLFIHCICSPQTAIDRLKYKETIGEKVFYYDISEMVLAYNATYDDILEDPQKPPTLEYNTETGELKKYNLYKLRLFDQIAGILL